jgi:hypothetical protein
MAVGAVKIFDKLATIALVQFDAKTNFELRASKGNAKHGIEILDKLAYNSTKLI